MVHDTKRREERPLDPLDSRMRKTKTRRHLIAEPFRPIRRVLFIFGLLVFAFALQFSTGALGSIDGYFHVRYSAIVAEAGWRGFPPPFPWLPLTILAPDRYFDHHMLFHIWLAAFTRSDVLLGGKLASAIGAGLAFACAYLFLVRRGIRHAEWWILGMLAASPGFLYRMEMPRVQSLSLLCLIIVLVILMSGRLIWLFPIAWLYTWLYDAFPLLLAMCGCAILAEGLITRTLVLTSLRYSLLGIAGGLVLNPYFPHDFEFIFRHYLAKLSIDETIPVGAEWYPIAIAEWLGWAGLIAILCGIAVLLVRYRHNLNRQLLTILFIAMFFMTLLWRSSRFVEYFVPFTIIALAEIFDLRIDRFFQSAPAKWRYWVTATLVLWLAASSAGAIVKLRGRPPASRYAGGAHWIAGNTSPGDIVFTSDWDDFPLLFFHNTRNRYVIGLDPTYLAERDLDLLSPLAIH